LHIDLLKIGCRLKVMSLCQHFDHPSKNMRDVGHRLCASELTVRTSRLINRTHQSTNAQVKGNIMLTTRTLEKSTKLAEHTIKSTQRVASKALENLSDALMDLRRQAEPLLNISSNEVSALAQRGAASVRDTSRQLRRQAQRASDRALNYIQDEPVKSILIAAAVGAAIVTLLSLISSSGDSD